MSLDGGFRGYFRVFFYHVSLERSQDKEVSSMMMCEH